MRLKELRIKKDITVKRICRELNISTRCYYYYESGERKLSPEMAKKVALIIGVNWWELYDDR